MFLKRGGGGKNNDRGSGIPFFFSFPPASRAAEIDGTTQVSDMVEEGSVLDIERLRVAPTEELLETLVRGISVEWPLEEGILIGASER